MKAYLILLVFLLVLPGVLSHGIVPEPVRSTTEQFEIVFSIDPLFPVTGKRTHFEVLIHDLDGTPLDGGDVKLVLAESDVSISLQREEAGHFDADWTFRRAGEYEAQLIINGQEVAHYDVEVDSFGVSGTMRAGVIILLILVLSGLLYKDCRRRKNGEKGTDTEDA